MGLHERTCWLATLGPDLLLRRLQRETLGGHLLAGWALTASCTSAGLSYVTFQYAGLLLAQDPSGSDTSTWLARVDVTNTGEPLQFSSSMAA